MGLKFSEEVITLGADTIIDKTFTFFKQGFRLSSAIGEPEYRDVTVSGVDVLNLPNAKADGLNYCKLYGKCEQSSTPTPLNPADIICNNGVVKVSPNLFNKDVAYTATLTNAVYWEINVPNGIYTCSTNIPYMNPTSASVWFDDNSSLSTSSNPVSPTQPRTVTITTGKAYIGVRTNNSSYNDLIAGNKYIQLELGSTATAYMPYGRIYTDGTTETVDMLGENLFDSGNIISGYRLNNVIGSMYGSTTTPKDINDAEGSFVSSLIPVEVGKTYIKNSPIVDSYHRFKVYNSERKSVRLVTDTNTVTIQEGEAYIAFCGYLTEINTACCGESLGDTATAENLLAVDTYKDVQSVIDGVITRKVGIKVFDGTEDWVKGSISFYAINVITNVLKNNSFIPYCTHYKGASGETDGTILANTNSIRLYYNGTYTIINVFAIFDDYATVDDFKTYLATQYANGTPVIIVYPTSSPTTETVTAQTLTTKKGTNTIEITQASLTGLPLEVSYKAGVTVTITQIENANLDNQVTVTIGE